MSSSSELYGLPSETIHKIHTVFQHYPDIKQIIIYGSRAKGNYHPGSDIDLIIMDEKSDYTQLLKIETALDDLLLPYKIDISLFWQIKNQNLIDHINRVGIIFYKKGINSRAI